jgi:hypothetical protein
MQPGVLYKPSNEQYPFADLMVKVDAKTLAFYQCTNSKSHPKSVFTFCKIKSSLGITGGVEVSKEVGKNQIVRVVSPATVKFHMHYMMRPEFAKEAVAKTTTSFFWEKVKENKSWNDLADKEIAFYVMTWPALFTNKC